jgi:hypothetical protein
MSHHKKSGRSALVGLLALMVFTLIAHPQYAQSANESRSIPTTSNPTGNGTQGLRTYANTSFEESDYACWPADADDNGLPDGTVGVDYQLTDYFSGQIWAYINQDKLRGWSTAHPIHNETNCTPADDGIRIIELQRSNTNNKAYDGNIFAELNAHYQTFIYQQVCVTSGDVIDFEFHHKTLTAGRTDITLFRFGIPSLGAGLRGPSVSADPEAQQRPIMYAASSSTVGSSNVTGAAHNSIILGENTFNTPAGTADANSQIIAGTEAGGTWARYSGRHTLPSTGWDGIRNLGFQAIDGPSATGGNLLDGITVGFRPIIDWGSSRDITLNEQSGTHQLRIRINGRVEAGTTIAIRKSAGTATSDSDFRIGVVNAGRLGRATVTHTSGSDVWLIEVPPGDYDGGVVPSARKGGLNIPVIISYDREDEGLEWLKFDIAAAGTNGSSADKWVAGDPTCDGSEKNDGVVLQVTNVNPTATPTLTLTPSLTNTPSPTNTMTPTPHPFAIRDVAVGASFTLAVLNNDTLVTWGFNREGQASLPRWMATKLVDQVEVGSNYAVALGRDGRVYGWGANDFGQMRIPTQASSGVRSISASLGHVMALKTNGDLVIWGRNDFKQTIAPLEARKRLTAIGAGHSHSLAVKGGKVIAWGRNTWGQTNVPRTLSNVTAVSGGFDHSLALRSNGTIVCWGRNNENQCRIPNGLKDVIAISAGVGYSLALTRDGVVYGWGRGNYGQSAVPAGLGKAGAISAGYVNSVIGMRDASVIAFGDSSLGSLVSRTPTVTP